MPVILALLDGMVNDLGNHGFFSQRVDLTAWDSIAACNTGINELKTMLFRPRTQTTEDSIGLPYRNGILHGMDLGYDNRKVAAKSWAALFATADWARRVEQGRKNAPNPEPEPTWCELVKLVQQNTEANIRLKQWQSRTLEVKPNPADTDPDSPEAALIEFLNAWRNKNYGVMAKRTDPFGQGTLNARAGELRSYYRDLRLDQFTIEKIVDTAPAVTEITVMGCGIQYQNSFAASGTFRLVNFDAQRNPVTHGSPGGTWFIMNWNPWQTSNAEKSSETT